MTSVIIRTTDNKCIILIFVNNWGINRSQLVESCLRYCCTVIRAGKHVIQSFTKVTLKSCLIWFQFILSSLFLIHLLIHWIIHSFIYRFINWFSHSAIRSSCRSLFDWFVESFTHPKTRSAPNIVAYHSHRCFVLCTKREMFYFLYVLLFNLTSVLLLHLLTCLTLALIHALIHPSFFYDNHYIMIAIILLKCKVMNLWSKLL